MREVCRTEAHAAAWANNLGSLLAAGLLSLFPDLAAKNTFRIAGKDFRIAGKEDMTLILGIIMAMSWP